MLRLKLYLALSATVLVLTSSVTAQDELRFRNGAVLRGKAVEMDASIVVFRTGDGLKSFNRSDVRAIYLSVEGEAGPGQPPGISLGEGWRAKRWVTFNKITAFAEEATQRKDVNVMSLSADGSRIGLLTQQGAFALDAQGGSLVQLSTRDTHGHLDFSADGKVVAWAGREGLWLANSDGSGKRKLPGGFAEGEQGVTGLRLTARGDRVFILSPARGVYALSTDGSNIKRLLSYEDLAKFNGHTVATFTYYQLHDGLSINSDGSRIVFTTRDNAFALNGDGSGLRKVSNYGFGSESLGWPIAQPQAVVSGDGSTIAWFASYGKPEHQHRLHFAAWNGQPLGSYHHVLGLQTLSLTHNGSHALRGEQLVRYARDGSDYHDPLDLGSALLPIWSYHGLSADGRRAVGISKPHPLVSGQVIRADFNAAALDAAPAFGTVEISPKFMLLDGSTKLRVTIKPPQPEQIESLRVRLLRSGADPKLAKVRWTYYDAIPLNDEGRESDAKAGDGVFSTDAIQFFTQELKGVPAGPLVVRLIAKSKAGHIYEVDVEGLEARTP
ncbi:MAG: hypothetical protein FD161_809 [Limisphaerales bacterium]|nr:MAG: hypothetical protein FD161_809 [Limisphaerales bacterium]KAG0509968.1 MAG: hypothetical protein E1N63_809 [Limisphaerales bacterium]TXT53142.1 MAG: hypothetical protein FD140_250 [Limisphaerales bacterium]